MRFFFCLILFSCVFVAYSSTAAANKNYILCTSRCSPITLSFSQASLLPVECREHTDENPIQDYALACSVEYRVDYTAQQVYLNFRFLNDTEAAEDQQPNEFLSQTIEIDLSGQVTQADMTTRRYGCNSKNDCARDFYLNTIEHLVKNGQAVVDDVKRKLYNQSLLMDERSRRRCTDSSKTGNKTSTLCRTGLCYASFTQNESNSSQQNKVQMCHYHQRPTLTSKIEHELNKGAYHHRESLEYHCNKNVCNRNDMVEIVRGLLTEYTHWNLKAHAMNDMQTKNFKSPSNKETMASSCLVIFLVMTQILI